MLKYIHNNLKTKSYFNTMSLFQYLQLQPNDPQDDGSVSELDQYTPDEVIDLSQDEDGATLIREWEEITVDLHSASQR
jgi:hypothetical protein